MKWYWWVLIVVVILVISIIAYKKLNKPKDALANLTDEDLRGILLAGNQISGAEIDAMDRAQLIDAIQKGGYLLTKV